MSPSTCYVCHLAGDYINSNVYDIRFFGNCGREAVWANSVVTQGVSRNTRTCGQDDQPNGRPLHRNVAL